MPTGATGGGRGIGGGRGQPGTGGMPGIIPGKGRGGRLFRGGIF